MEEVKDFASIGQNTQRCDNVKHKKQKAVESCKYSGTGHLWRHCPGYGKMCGRCSKTNHIGWCRDQCSGSSKARNHLRVADQSTKSDRTIETLCATKIIQWY